QSRTADSFDATPKLVIYNPRLGHFPQNTQRNFRGASESAKSPSYLSFRGWSCSCGVSRWQSVIDAGFNHRLTDTSTRWEILAGFTYLLPHRLSMNRLG